jgi:hypothetical protein
MPKKNGTVGSPSRPKERDYYAPIKSKLEERLREKGVNVYLEQTADTNFSETLKAAIPRGHEIIFNFLRSSRPDMTGYLPDKFGSKYFMIVEIKLDLLKLEDIYQLRRYADLFNAQCAFLISPQPIPEELKRLASVVHPVLNSGHWRQVFRLVQFDLEKKDFIEWFPTNPFEEAHRWQDYQVG